MVHTIIGHIENQELADSLADCEPGEEKTITLKVTKTDTGSLTGTVTGVEGYAAGEAESEEEGDMGRMNGGGKYPSSKKVPKAIVMVGMGMGKGMNR